VNPPEGTCRLLRTSVSMDQVTLRNGATSSSTLGRSGGAETNFWRVDSNGTNLTRHSRLNERVPAARMTVSVVLLDAAENHSLNAFHRGWLAGNNHQSLLSPTHSPRRQNGPAFEVREADTRSARLSSLVVGKNRRSNSIRAACRALPSCLPEKPSVRVREKGVDNCGSSAG